MQPNWATCTPVQIWLAADAAKMSAFGAVMATSFTLTTIGYAGAAWSIGLAALRAF